MLRIVSYAALLVSLVSLASVAFGPHTANAQSTGDGAALAEPQTDASPEGKVVPKAKVAPRDPNKGAVTNLPIPRFVTLKTGEGNARRGPGLTHRIDWVFTRAGMPLKITGEYDNWRRVEDKEGLGGWVHYSLLSGVRAVLVNVDSLDLHDSADPNSAVVLRAERDVVARLQECQRDWCRLSVDGEKGWAPKSDLWGVGPDEILD